MKIELSLSPEEMRDVVKALKKQEGRVPYWQEHGTGRWAHCPVCGERVVYDLNRYCTVCGQKLDWQEVEE